MILQATSPLRKKDVEKIIKIAKKYNLNTLHSVNIYPNKKKIFEKKNLFFLIKKYRLIIMIILIMELFICLNYNTLRKIIQFMRRP